MFHLSAAEPEAEAEESAVNKTCLYLKPDQMIYVPEPEQIKSSLRQRAERRNQTEDKQSERSCLSLCFNNDRTLRQTAH